LIGAKVTLLVVTLFVSVPSVKVMVCVIVSTPFTPAVSTYEVPFATDPSSRWVATNGMGLVSSLTSVVTTGFFTEVTGVSSFVVDSGGVEFVAPTAIVHKATVEMTLNFPIRDKFRNQVFAFSINSNLI
jgi:hypothetical protein